MLAVLTFLKGKIAILIFSIILILLSIIIYFQYDNFFLKTENQVIKQSIDASENDNKVRLIEQNYVIDTIPKDISDKNTEESYSESLRKYKEEKSSK